MNITKVLMDEHVFILKGLKFLKMARDNIENNQHPPKEFFECAVPFFRHYADQYHHFKEEFLMFGYFAQKKEGKLDLEIGSLRHQHENGRQYITNIEKSINGYDMENEVAVTTLLSNLASFCSILSRHIYMEDNLFFPLVEDELTNEEKENILEQFSEEETALEERNPVKKNMDLLKEMEKLINIKE